MGFDVYSATGELQTLLHEQQWALGHWACSQPKGCSYHPHMSLEMFSSTELLGLVTYPGFGLSDLQRTKTWERNGRIQDQHGLHGKTIVYK